MKKILVGISMIVMMLMNVGAATAQGSQTKPVDSYGFLNAPDGSAWTYTAAFTKTGWGDLTMAELSIFDSNNELVGKIVDSLKLEEGMIAYNQVEINSLVTKTFFNNDDKYELMIFLHAQTKDFEGRRLNHVFSIANGETVTEPITTVEGRQVYALNRADFANENYVMVFERDSASTKADHTLCYDVHYKSILGGLKRTFRVPYANVAALNDMQPIFVVKYEGQLYFILQQYEKPYFVPGTPYDQDPVVNPDNNLVITFMNQLFKTLHTTKIPVVQDEDKKFLYTFPMLGGLNGIKDIILLDNEIGAPTPKYLVTYDKLNKESDGSVTSYYMYNVEGKREKTIIENAMGRIMMSHIAGQEEQWLFMKEEYDGEFLFVNLPSGDIQAEISVYLEDGKTISSQIDRYPKGDSYEYAVALLNGNNEEDGTVSQDIAWLNADGSFNRYENINLGQYIEAAQVNITSSALNPWVINTDDAREYMVLVKRYNPNNTSDKETAFLVCNTKGEILLDYGKDEEKGELSMVYLLDKGTNPSILCVYQKNGAFTMHYTPLPLNKSELKGSGTAKDPYQLASAYDFTLIDKNPAAHYEVVKDINFLLIPFEGPKKAFLGSLDGKNHVLSNLCLIDGGLFNEIKDTVKVKNICFKKPMLVLSDQNFSPAGILANSMQGGITEAGVALTATLTNVHVINPVIRGVGYKEIVGTIVGAAALNLDVNACSVVGADIVAPEAQVGGVIGKANTFTNIRACLFTGKAEGNIVGGITSEVSNGEPVYDCRVDADLYGRNTVGGIIGHSGRSKVYNNIVSGKLTLADTAKIGKVGGILGSVATDATGLLKDTLVENCLVALSEIKVPAGEQVIAHRVVGFSSGDDFEYDVDFSKPESEWERDYFAPETHFQNNYVVSNLAALDANVQQTDTTTEGATLAWTEVTAEWLSAHGYKLGADLSTPWVFEKNALKLWYEAEDLYTDYDEPLKSVYRTYTSADSLCIVNKTKEEGKIYCTITAEDNFDQLALIFNVDKADTAIIIPEGVYTIDASEKKGTVAANSGVQGDKVSPSYYAQLTGDGSVAYPLWLLVNGTVKVEKSETGTIHIEVNAFNSYAAEVHVVYNAVGSGLENIVGDGNSGNDVIKVIKNGQLIIIRNGEMYNVIGARLK